MILGFLGVDLVVSEKAGDAKQKAMSRNENLTVYFILKDFVGIVYLLESKLFKV